MVKAIIFDLDDTLWKTFKPSYKRYRLLARDLHLRVPTESDFKKQWGFAGWTEWLHGLWPGIDAAAFRKAYHRMFPFETYKLFSGVKELLELLSKKKVIFGILSSRHSDSIFEKAKLSGLDLGQFAFIYTEDKLEFKKPDARAFDKPLKDLSSLGVSKEQVLYVGDHIADFFAAKAAGLDFFAVLTGISTKQDFLAAGLSKEKILENVSDILNAIKI